MGLATKYLQVSKKTIKKIKRYNVFFRSRVVGRKGRRVACRPVDEFKKFSAIKRDSLIHDQGELVLRGVSVWHCQRNSGGVIVYTTSSLKKLSINCHLSSSLKTTTTTNIADSGK